VDCYAARLRERFRTALAAAVPAPSSGTAHDLRIDPGTGVDAEPRVDAEQAYRRAAISALRKRAEFGQLLSSG